MFRWLDLVRLADAQLGTIDIAEVNLACAEGLPCAPTTRQAAECLDRLDHYARCVAHYTHRCRPDYDRRPEHYDYSEKKFRMVCMVRLLQKEFGVLYHEAKISADTPFGTEDSFIHGALLGEGGTCASLPVIYAAVGRRLGYPLKLVATASAAAGHLFVRWDEPGGERFNFEANNRSMDSPSDAEYRSGIYSFVTPEVERQGCFLVSQAPRDELSGFMGQRGHCWLRAGIWRPATTAFAWAWSLQLQNVLLKNRLISSMNGWGAELQWRQPAGFPEMFMTWPPRRFPDTVPLNFEKDILTLEAWENILNNPDWDRLFWEPMRRGVPVRRPIAAVIVGNTVGCDIGLRFAS